MIRIDGLFETHLTVADLRRSVEFYRDRLGLEPAVILANRRVAFFWLGQGDRRSMLGLWETGDGPQRMSLHCAFSVGLEALLAAPAALRDSGIEALDFDNRATDEPVVLAWMPAAAIYFRDPDGNLLEFLALLLEAPRPELGVVGWSEWRRTA